MKPARCGSLSVNLLEQLERLLGERAIDRKQFAGMLAQGFKRSEIGVLPSSVDCVLLGDISRTKTSGVRSVFIMGVNEGILPAPVSDDSLFSGRELDSMNQMGAQLEPDQSMQISPAELRYIFGLFVSDRKAVCIL